MEKEPLYCAIDISKATLDVDAAALALPEQLGNDQVGYRQLIKAAQKYPGLVHFVFEASGPYHLGLALALWEALASFERSKSGTGALFCQGPGQS